MTDSVVSIARGALLFAATVLFAAIGPHPEAAAPVAREAPLFLLARHKLMISTYDYPVTENIDVAGRAMGLVRLKPGESFSLNRRLGKRTPQKGYKIAPVYAGGGANIKEFGGGLCMVSSVLYNVFLKAGLTILERHPHMKIVNYSPAGLDAAINWGFKDLRVRNDSRHPIAFRMYRLGRVVYAEVSGSLKPGREIVIKRFVSKAIIPGRVRNGFRVRTVRTFYQDGRLLRQEVLSEDTFLPIDFGG